MAISQAQYDREVLEQAFYLFRETLGDYYAEEIVEADLSSAVSDNSHHVLDGHDWFRRNSGAAHYGAIIEYAQDAGVNVDHHFDLTAIVDQQSTDDILQSLAYRHFQAHVEQRANDILNR